MFRRSMRRFTVLLLVIVICGSSSSSSRTATASTGRTAAAAAWIIPPSASLLSASNDAESILRRQQQQQQQQQQQNQRKQQQQQQQQQLCFQLVQRAADLTKRGDMTAAYEAVGLWEQVAATAAAAAAPIASSPDTSTAGTTTTTAAAAADDDNNDDNDDSDMLPASVRAMSYALQAANLVRVGQDAAALGAYDNAIIAIMTAAAASTCTYSTASNTDDSTTTMRDFALLGKAKSLQRLLRYERAKEQFLQLITVVAAAAPTTSASATAAAAAATTNPNTAAATAAAAIIGAATCAMRLGDIAGAIHALEQFFSTNGNDDDMDSSFREARCMMEALKCIDGKGNTETQQQQTIRMLSSSSSLSAMTNRSSAFVSPLYKWQYYYNSCAPSPDYDDNDDDTISHKDCMDRTKKSTFMDYCKVNVGAFDDPMLLHLDDKVLLHTLLTSSSTTGTETTKQFWPPGMILPASALPRLLQGGGDGSDGGGGMQASWICKQRSGYGSHGNTIVTASPEFAEAVALFAAEEHGDDIAKPKEDHERCLLQRMVEPPLLLEGRKKFSLRVYVVVVFGATSLNTEADPPPPDVYIGKEGLVKVASVPFEEPTTAAVSGDDDNNEGAVPLRLDPRMHMTNSGREADMQQETFQYLRQELSASSFDEIWSSTVTAVGSVMKLYEEHCKASNNSNASVTRYKLAALGIPKILGFDFVVDASRNAWLVEVNRFPGLEPRNAMDAAVKHQVVRDAWQVACNRRCCDSDARNKMPAWLALDFADVLDCRDNNTSSLERVDWFKKPN